jgi:hypothetical protein
MVRYVLRKRQHRRCEVDFEELRLERRNVQAHDLVFVLLRFGRARRLCCRH